MKAITFILSFSLLIFNVAGNPSPNHDHSWLVLYWPMGICSQPSRHCVQQKDYFTIHGVWPVNKTGQTITNCGTNVTLKARLHNETALVNSLLDYWPNLEAPRNDSEKQFEFWQYQYDKHASCSQLEPMPLVYLNRAIQLQNKYNMLAALQKSNIIPGHSYSKQDYSKAVQAATGVNDFFLRCIAGNQEFILKEIVICIDRGSVNAIPCSQKETQKDNCGTGMINLPSAVAGAGS